jgi:hypothetical protein
VSTTAVLIALVSLDLVAVIGLTVWAEIRVRKLEQPRGCALVVPFLGIASLLAAAFWLILTQTPEGSKGPDLFEAGSSFVIAAAGLGAGCVLVRSLSHKNG